MTLHSPDTATDESLAWFADTFETVIEATLDLCRVWIERGTQWSPSSSAKCLVRKEPPVGRVSRGKVNLHGLGPDTSRQQAR